MLMTRTDDISEIRRSALMLLAITGVMCSAAAAYDHPDDEHLMHWRQPWPNTENGEEEWAGEGPIYADELPYDKRAQHYSFGLGKRGPDYSFGSGKRLADYSFGLGKRMQQYSFGLGKRLPNEFSFGLGKRAKDFSFGLGKRSAGSYSFGLGNRDSMDAGNFASDQKNKLVYPVKKLKSFSFGLGKRSTDDDELQNSDEPQDGSTNKEEDKSTRYKREIQIDNFVDYRDLLEEQMPDGFYEDKRKNLYQFGLGKRSQVDDISYISDDDEDDLMKRGREKFSFGLGKRVPSYEFGLGKRVPSYEFGLGKRVPSYEFGLGKRVPSYEFGLGKRAPSYEFGLGKRVPSYEFGLGKRAPSYEFGLGKRVPSYEFGLGKRDDDGTVESQFVSNGVQLTDSEESPKRFGFIRRSYNFGLGKRSLADLIKKNIKDFSFGLGKRSVEKSKPLHRSYDFGLGKRGDPKLYGFGLGK